MPSLSARKKEKAFLSIDSSVLPSTTSLQKAEMKRSLKKKTKKNPLE